MTTGEEHVDGHAAMRRDQRGDEHHVSHSVAQCTGDLWSDDAAPRVRDQDHRTITARRDVVCRDLSGDVGSHTTEIERAISATG